jgi:hypothetical protein
MITWNYIRDEIRIVLISKLFVAIQLRILYFSVSYLNTVIKTYKINIWVDECGDVGFNAM